MILSAAVWQTGHTIVPSDGPGIFALPLGVAGTRILGWYLSFCQLPPVHLSSTRNLDGLLLITTILLLYNYYVTTMYYLFTTILILCCYLLCCYLLCYQVTLSYYVVVLLCHNDTWLLCYYVTMSLYLTGTLLLGLLVILCRYVTVSLWHQVMTSPGYYVTTTLNENCRNLAGLLIAGLLTTGLLICCRRDAILCIFV